jgi:hypothetical protein
VSAPRPRGITKKVYIDEGRIVFARSGDPDDRLGDLLLREGLITLDQLEAALAQLVGSKRLGTILVDAGHLSPENLVRAVQTRCRGSSSRCSRWTRASTPSSREPLPTDEVITLGMRTAEILLAGHPADPLVLANPEERRSAVQPIPARSAWHEVLDGLDIRDGERMLLQRLDAPARGAPRRRAVPGGVPLELRDLSSPLGFPRLGVVKEVDRGGESSPGAAIEGRLERTHLPEILVRICREQVTGVLHMARGTIERTLHIKQGSCIFATSNAVDDGLVAHLLRRGVISLSDREETARRMLSNKRVGTILLEMGVIDEGDLRATVREQLSRSSSTRSAGTGGLPVPCGRASDDRGDHADALSRGSHLRRGAPRHVVVARARRLRGLGCPPGAPTRVPVGARQHDDRTRGMGADLAPQGSENGGPDLP